MGSQIAPKSFAPPVPYGKSPNQIVTPTQPVPYVGADQGTPTPALSGYNMSPANPAPTDSTLPTAPAGPITADTGGPGSRIRQRFNAPQFDTMPFFGRY